MILYDLLNVQNFSLLDANVIMQITLVRDFLR